MLKDVIKVVLLFGRLPSFCLFPSLFFLSEDILGVLSVWDGFVIFLKDFLSVRLSIDSGDSLAFFLCHHSVMLFSFRRRPRPVRSKAAGTASQRPQPRPPADRELN